jgi:hypothetical protein
MFFGGEAKEDDCTGGTTYWFEGMREMLDNERLYFGEVEDRERFYQRGDTVDIDAEDRTSGRLGFSNYKGGVRKIERGKVYD